MDTASAISVLQLFNEKADRLESSSFLATLMNQPTGAEFRWQEGVGASSTRTGPEGESIEAFILTLRLFLVGLEPISFRRMAELYANLPVEQARKDEFDRARDFLNRALAEPSDIVAFDQALTRGDIFYTFLYGDLAHVNNEDKVRAFRQWSEHPFGFPILQNVFVVTCFDIVRAIMSVRETNKATLHELEQQGAAA